MKYSPEDIVLIRIAHELLDNSKLSSSEAAAFEQWMWKAITAGGYDCMFGFVEPFLPAFDPNNAVQTELEVQTACVKAWLDDQFVLFREEFPVPSAPVIKVKKAAEPVSGVKEVYVHPAGSFGPALPRHLAINRHGLAPHEDVDHPMWVRQDAWESGLTDEAIEYVDGLLEDEPVFRDSPVVMADIIREVNADAAHTGLNPVMNDVESGLFATAVAAKYEERWLSLCEGEVLKSELGTCVDVEPWPDELPEEPGSEKWTWRMRKVVKGAFRSLLDATTVRVFDGEVVRGIARRLCAGNVLQPAIRVDPEPSFLSLFRDGVWGEVRAALGAVTTVEFLVVYMLDHPGYIFRGNVAVNQAYVQQGTELVAGNVSFKRVLGGCSAITFLRWGESLDLSAV